ncbi:hypothetical protein IQ235_09910 [Oscillatoriales cyanobacterium LEGE 11467]|uniref:Cell division protein FtsL n=1 Tax=Zarconia navalis LEGE 11467 TaxID=1828826 RepID=A0A928Z750_9CYAN|nr:hypothetical protein [Zarconia navalis]MBE9041092.1 hypothetical protein [Zarconia navalis LEGE 11467]
MALALDSHRPARRNRQLSSTPSQRHSKVTPISPDRRSSVAGSIATADSLPRRSRAKATPVGKQRRSTSPKQVVAFQQRTQQQPVWLRWLSLLQRSSSALGFFLVAATLVVYGSTVYSQQRWDAASEQLDDLRRDERQFLEKMESLKQQVAEQTATSQTGLVVPKRENFLFLKPASARPAPRNSAPVSRSGTSEPMGY